MRQFNTRIGELNVVLNIEKYDLVKYTASGSFEFGYIAPEKQFNTSEKIRWAYSKMDSIQVYVPSAWEKMPPAELRPMIQALGEVVFNGLKSYGMQPVSRQELFGPTVDQPL